MGWLEATVQIVGWIAGAFCVWVIARYLLGEV